jgi:CheY-like chemotaxis protein
MAKILVVEDNEVNRLMLSRLLQRNGYAVVMAEDGEQGRRLAVSEQPDLIVMDIALPGVDGLRVTRRLKNDESTSRIPIIVLTAYSENRKDAIAAGCDEYAVKPVGFKTLNLMIQHLLRKSTRRPAVEAPEDERTFA